MKKQHKIDQPVVCL